MAMRRWLSLGIANVRWRLCAWFGCCCLSALSVVLWWPLGIIPFIVLGLATAALIKGGRLP